MAEPVKIFPDDGHNRDLVANVHPADWRNPRVTGVYDMVVVGAGTAGLISAAGAAGLGAKVALVERHLMGGDCLNVGCVPSKCLIRSGRALADVRDAALFGVNVPPGVTADFGVVMDRLRRLRARISAHDSVARFMDLGVDVFLGRATFTGPDRVEVDGQTLAFKRGVIATGAAPGSLPFEGLEAAGYLTNETVFNLTELPPRLAVLGAGPLGCELAQAFGRLGSRVTVIARGPRIMSREDEDAARVVEGALNRDGLDLMLETSVKRVSVTSGEKVISVECRTAAEEIRVDHILVAGGRRPKVEGLGLESAGVEYDPKGGVKVDDNLRSTNRRLFAAGDVCLKHKFTHTADAAARIVIQNALFRGKKRLSALNVPWCTYTDPEVAHVGLYPSQAEERGMAVTTFVEPLEDVDRAIADGEEEGFVKVHVRRGTDKIVGATIVARHAGEMISEISVAMAGNVGLKIISGVIHPYPTQVEAIKRVADAYQRTRLTPRAMKLMRLLIKMLR